MSFMLPNLGYGLGLRAKHYSYIFDHRPAIDWFEIISENFMESEGRPRHNLERVLQDYPIVMHGVSMSIGTVDPLNSDYLQKLKKLIDWVNPIWVSDHLCWTGIAHHNTHDLLPLSYTDESLRNIVSKIKQVQDYLGRRIVLENPSTYLEFKSSQMPEAEFIARMADEADCLLLLDVNNVYVSCFNHRLNPQAYLDALPLERVIQIHLSGHDNKGTHIIDTHDDYVIDDVWNLYRYVLHKSGRIPNTMVEWDDKIPDFPVLSGELEKAKLAAHSTENFVIPPILGSRETTKHQYGNSLAEEQLLMQKAIFEGGHFNSHPETWIVAKDNFSPCNQLDVYINSYRARLFDVVAEDYPVLRHYLGDETFDVLITEFVNSIRPDHFNIARYALKLSSFMVAEANCDPFAHELTLLETALCELIDIPDSGALTMDHLEGLQTDDLMTLKLHPRSTLRLFSFSYDIDTYYQDVMAGKGPPPPDVQTNYLVVFRHENVVWRMRLEKDEYLLLESLFGGTSVGQALKNLNMATPEVVSNYFCRWMRNGLFAAHVYTGTTTHQELPHAAA